MVAIMDIQVGSLVRTYHGGLGFVSSVYDQFIKLDNKGVLYNKRTVALINKSIGVYTNIYKAELIALYNKQTILIGCIINNNNVICEAQYISHDGDNCFFNINNKETKIAITDIYYLKTKSLECIL